MHTHSSEPTAGRPISNADMLRACIYGLIDAQNWALAARYTVALDRIERAQARPAPQAMPSPVTPAAPPHPAPDLAAARERSRQLHAATLAARRAAAEAAAPAEDGSTPPPPEVLELARLLGINPPFT